MAQVKVYGLRVPLSRRRAALSEAVHQSVVEALSYPVEKRFHRFMALDPEDFLFPADRSEDYTVIEISLFEGRSAGAKKALIRALFRRVEAACGIAAQDLEITIFETPKGNWGIRGMPGDELALGYRVEV